MGRPILYMLTASPPACSVKMLADMLGVQLDQKQVDWKAMEHKSTGYLKMNPMGTIPLLKDGDFVVSESHAIMKYLLEKYGKNHQESLYPKDLRTRTTVDQCMFFNSGLFFIRLKVVALPTILEGLKGPSPKHLADIASAYQVVESYLQSREYIAAEHLTLADLAVGSTAAFMQPIMKLDVERFPRTSEWLARLEKEPSFSKFSEPGVALFEKTLNICWENNKNK